MSNPFSYLVIALVIGAIMFISWGFALYVRHLLLKGYDDETK